MWDFYESQLAVLVFFSAFFYGLDRKVSRKAAPKERSDNLENGNVAHPENVSSLARKYLTVYAIVMGADWLQGPYVYSLYNEEYEFPERMVAFLFVTGFMSAALTAPLVGAWADQHGRRRLCMAFCVTYAITCMCITVPSLPILFLGRVLGGLSTSILYSAFESWLVSSSNQLALHQSALSNILGRATLVNGIVAAIAGVVSNKLVSTTLTFKAPFIASGALLVLAWFVINRTWHENRGGTSSGDDDGIFQLRRLGQAWDIVRSDPLLLVLGLTQTCFEGSMYLFVFVWVPTLQEASHSATLPLGIIFSAFMLSMMIGSLLYTAIVSNPPPTRPGQQADSSLTLHAKLSSLVCATSALALAASVSSPSEYVRFGAFCVFEACVGMYYPVQGMLRGTLIADGHRATLSALFRVPLNVFVVTSLLTGVGGARNLVLSACSAILGFSSIMTGLVIVRSASEAPHSENLRPA
ncbi:hypothetical protein BJ322DRAFT_1048492 [Thelephora terrestris]|uniref:Molybdate-anion transporter n=1 Tax=Thelephora terrestris TaxID=56493 RepID=A0A9P6HJT5_9AGAM|nr:hypothetical protein BJ322DRAFT_1048492 [Thelephora terrestris]